MIERLGLWLREQACGPFGAFLAQRENPNMSGAEFLARAFGVYEIAVATGDLPPPPTLEIL
jgi:hypothetical protein